MILANPLALTFPQPQNAGTEQEADGGVKMQKAAKTLLFLVLENVPSVKGWRLHCCTLLPCSVLTVLDYFAVSCQSLNINALCLILSELLVTGAKGK